MADPDKQNDEPVEEMAETPPNVEAAAKKTALAEKPNGPDQAAEAAKEAELKAKDTAAATAIRDNLKPKEDTSTDPDPKITPEELYEKVIAKDMDKMIDTLNLRPAITEAKTALSRSESDKTTAEKQAVKILLKQFKKIPFSAWTFFPKAIIGEKRLNCSGAAMIFGHIMNKELKIKTELANPVGHAANLVTYNDGTTQYVDPRNNEIHAISLTEKIDERDGYKVYKVRSKGLEYRLMPVVSHERGDTLVMLENTNAMEKEKANDKEAREIDAKYKTPTSKEYAKKYVHGHFIKESYDEPQWEKEMKDAKKRRTLFTLPILGRVMRKLF